jgi:hypothetical protein
MSVATAEANFCELAADTRWSQSSHQKELLPSQRDVKRIATATTGITPVIYAVVLIRAVYESWGLLQTVACARSMSPGLSVTLRNGRLIEIPNV